MSKNTQTLTDTDTVETPDEVVVETRAIDVIMTELLSTDADRAAERTQALADIDAKYTEKITALTVELENHPLKAGMAALFAGMAPKAKATTNATSDKAAAFVLVNRSTGAEITVDGKPKMYSSEVKLIAPSLKEVIADLSDVALKRLSDGAILDHALGFKAARSA